MKAITLDITVPLNKTESLCAWDLELLHKCGEDFIPLSLLWDNVWAESWKPVVASLPNFAV